MKLRRFSKLFTVTAILVGLVSASGIISGLSAIIEGYEIILGLLSVALGILGGITVFRYFKMKLIEPWIYYVWLIPQTLSFTIDTYDHINKTVSGDLVYDTFLLPNSAFLLAWELRNNSFFVANFNLIAILGILIFTFILSRLKDDENITE